MPPDEPRERPKVQRSTFYLIGCQRCGKFEEPPKPHVSDVIAAQEPMRCRHCGDVLLLIECFLAPQTKAWQERPGAMWQHVAFPELLPNSQGRQLWTGV
jgi:ribosomal protein S27E